MSNADVGIAILAIPVVIFGLGLLMLVAPRAFVYINLLLIDPLKNRGDPASPSEAVSQAELDRLPPEQRAALDSGTRRVAELGFNVATHGRARSESGWTLGAVLLNESEGTSGHVMVTRIELPDFPPVSSDNLGFCTEFEDGTAILTVNDGQTVFRPDPLCDTVRWPGMCDPAVLYRLHAARVARDRRGRPTRLPTPEGAFAYMVAMDMKTLWRQAEAGYLRFDAADGVFRRTLTGAYVFRWKMLWPWKQRLAARHERKLRAVLEELGMGTPEQYSPDPKGAVPPGLHYESAPESPMSDTASA